MCDDTTNHQLPLFPEFEELTRVCTRCKKPLPATTEYFYLKEGKLETRCKPCIRELSQLRREKLPDYNKDYYWANRDSELERAKKWKQDNAEHVLEYARQYREANPEYRHEYYVKNKDRLIAQAKAYAEAHPEWRKEYQRHYYYENREKRLDSRRRYRLNHPDRIKAYQKQYRENNRSYNRERGRRYYKANPHRFKELRKSYRGRSRIYEANRRAREMNVEGSFTKQDIDRITQEQNGCCYYCGIHTVLTIDHKTPLSRGGSNYPENLCMACHSCNSQKGAKTEDEYWEWLFKILMQIRP